MKKYLISRKVRARHRSGGHLAARKNRPLSNHATFLPKSPTTGAPMKLPDAGGVPAGWQSSFTSPDHRLKHPPTAASRPGNFHNSYFPFASLLRCARYGFDGSINRMKIFEENIDPNKAARKKEMALLIPTFLVFILVVIHLITATGNIPAWG
jgi:hypothetical protein